MKITKPDHTLVLQGYHAINQQPVLFISIGYVVEANHELVKEPQAWPWLLPYFDKEPVDMVFKKQHGTFAVAGNAYAQPAGSTTTKMAVQAQLGSLEKTLYVFGDRHWEQGITGWKPTEPLPFSKMPVDLSHAFGAKSKADNPHGKGYFSQPTQVGNPLPNIELPTQLILSPTDCPAVATFNALPAAAPEKQRWLGQVDEMWQEQHFPWLPIDTDPRWFDGVPSDQSQASYWQGTESWSVRGMHATHTIVSGVLPGLRPRLLVRQKTNSTVAPQLTEADLDLDTVWLFPNEERLLLWYRAAIPVSREDAKDILALGIFTEQNTDEPSTLSQLEQQWLKLEPTTPEELAPLPAIAPQAALAASALSAEAIAFQQELESKIKGAFNTGIDEANEALAKLEKQTGIQIPKIEPMAFDPVHPISDAEPELSAAEFEKKLRHDVESALEQGRAEAEQAIHDLAKQMDMDPKALLDLIPPAGSAASVGATDISALLKQSPLDKDLQQTILSQAKEAEQLEANIKQQIAAQMPTLSSPSETEDLSFLSDMDKLTEHLISGGTLVGLTLAHANFQALNLQKVDFNQAILEHCDFSQADLTEANFSGAKITNCNFHSAQLNASTWKGADIDDSDFSFARLEQAQMAQTTFVSCLFNQAQMAKINLQKSSFDQCELNQAMLQQANLTSANLMQSQLINADLTQAQWPDARVSMQSDCSQSRFTQANLEGASFQNSVFTAANFSEANLNKAFIQESVLDQSTAQFVMAKNASFHDVSLHHIKWRGANLMQSFFMYSSLVNADLQDANLFGVDARTTEINTVFLTNSLVARSTLAKEKK